MENKTESAGAEQTLASSCDILAPPPDSLLKSQPPASQLLVTLNGLCRICTNAWMFDEGMSPAQAADYLETKREILRYGHSWCVRAREALKASGGDCADRMLNPGAKVWSSGLKAKILEVERLFCGLAVCLTTPDSVIGDKPQRMAELALGLLMPGGVVDNKPQRMAELGGAFAKARDELDDAIERGAGYRNKPDTDYAAHLLETRLDLTQTEIAQKAGYASPSAMTGNKRLKAIIKCRKRQKSRSLPPGLRTNDGRVEAVDSGE